MNPEEHEPLPAPRPLRHYLRAAQITLALDLAYVGLLVWEWRGNDQLPSQFFHSAALAGLAVCSIVSWTTYFVGRGQLQIEERLRADVVMSQAQTEGRALAEVARLRNEVVQLGTEMRGMHDDMLQALARVAGGIRGNSHRLEQLGERLDDVGESTGGIVVATGRVVERSDRDRDQLVAGLHDRVEGLAKSVEDIGANVARRIETARSEGQAEGYVEGVRDRLKRPGPERPASGG